MKVIVDATIVVDGLGKGNAIVRKAQISHCLQSNVKKVLAKGFGLPSCNDDGIFGFLCGLITQEAGAHPKLKVWHVNRPQSPFLAQGFGRKFDAIRSCCNRRRRRFFVVVVFAPVGVRIGHPLEGFLVERLHSFVGSWRKELQMVLLMFVFGSFAVVVCLYVLFVVVVVVVVVIVVICWGRFGRKFG